MTAQEGGDIIDSVVYHHPAVVEGAVLGYLQVSREYSARLVVVK